MSDRDAAAVPIQGFEPAVTDTEAAKTWEPVSDRKIRVGIAGYGVCAFGAAFHFQDHPNVTVAAVADLDPDKCAELSKLCRCETMYSSCEELIGDASLEAIFIATDAPSHGRLAIAALEAGVHVASAVPAVLGSLEEADALFAAVQTAGCKYMMFETSYFHSDLYTMREMYRTGALGKVVYAEGEYWHYFGTPLAAHKGWRTGLPPQWYPTHSNAYYVGVTGGSFTEVSCMGMPSPVDHLKPENNQYGNPFGTEIALFAPAKAAWPGWRSVGIRRARVGRGGAFARSRGPFTASSRVTRRTMCRRQSYGRRFLQELKPAVTAVPTAISWPSSLRRSSWTAIPSWTWPNP